MQNTDKCVGSELLSPLHRGHILSTMSMIFSDDSNFDSLSEISYDSFSDLPPAMGLIRSYYLPQASDTNVMQEAKDEPLSSFAENPTKTVERDALVESNFTRPDQVEKACVEEAKWPWGKGNKNRGMPRYFVILLFAILAAAAILLGLIILYVILSNQSTTPTQEQPLVYTLPSRIPDDHNNNKNIHHAHVLAPTDEEVESEEPIEQTSHEITDDVLEEAEKPDQVEKEAEKDAEEFNAETATPETATPEVAVVSESTTQGTTNITPVMRRRPTSTRRMPPATTTLQFYEPLDGEVTETCMERMALGSPSGVYTINAGQDQPFQVYCDMETTDGGWIVVQKRLDGEFDFQRRIMKEYIRGFGDLKTSHWIGLDKLEKLAPVGSPPATLRIEFEGDVCNENCTRRYPGSWEAEWKVNFGGKKDGYKLYVTGHGVGSAVANGSDPLLSSNGIRFTTNDSDNDNNKDVNCSHFRNSGPWWHSKECSDIALNGYRQTRSEKYNVGDKSQHKKRYYSYELRGEFFNGEPFVVHVRRSKILLKTNIQSRK